MFTPPLREKENQPKLWDGLKHDHLQVVSTDHCPFCFEDQKMLGKDDFTKIPNGGPGIENRLQLIHHHGVNAGKMSLNRFVEITSTAPARIFGMYPKKGEIAAGQRRRSSWSGTRTRSYTISAQTHHMRVDYSMFEGFKVRGNARHGVFARRGDRGGRQVPGQAGPRQLSAARGARGRMEVTPKPRYDLSLYNADLAPVPPRTAHLGHIQLRRAVVCDVGVRAHVHAGLGTDRRRHELVAGDRARFCWGI